VQKDAVAAAGGFGVPDAVLVLTFDRLGLAGHALLGSGAVPIIHPWGYRPARRSVPQLATIERVGPRPVCM
jgi:hypothetical protein